MTKYWLNKKRRDIAILIHPSSLPPEESKLMMTYCDNTTDHTPSIKDQVTELAKVKLENQIKL